jgi:hypothetical protein
MKIDKPYPSLEANQTTYSTVFLSLGDVEGSGSIAKLDASERSTSHPGHFISRERGPGTN